MFAGLLRAAQRAAAIMSLLRSAQLNGHDPHAYIKDILMRLCAHRASDIAALLVAETGQYLPSPTRLFRRDVGRRVFS